MARSQFNFDDNHPALAFISVGGSVCVQPLLLWARIVRCCTARAERGLLIPLSTNYSAQLDRIISTCGIGVTFRESISPISKVIKIRRAPIAILVVLISLK